MKKKLLGVLLLLSAYLIYFFIQDQFIRLQYDKIATRSNIVLKELLPIIKKKKQLDYLIIGDSSAFHSLIPIELSKDSWSICIPGSRISDFKNILNDIDLSKVKKGIIIQNSFSRSHYKDDFYQYIIPSELYDLSDYASVLKEDFKEMKVSNLEIISFAISVLQTELYLTLKDLKNLQDFIINTIDSRPGYQKVFTSEILNAQGFYQIKGFPTLGNTHKKFQVWLSSHELNSITRILELIGNKKLYIILPDWIKDTENAELVVRKLKSIKSEKLVLVDKMATGIDKKDYWDNSHLKLNGSLIFTKNLKKFIEKN